MRERRKRKGLGEREGEGRGKGVRGGGRVRKVEEVRHEGKDEEGKRMRGIEKENEEEAKESGCERRSRIWISGGGRKECWERLRREETRERMRSRRGMRERMRSRRGMRERRRIRRRGCEEEENREKR
jgi:hypothetical protein